MKKINAMLLIGIIGTAVFGCHFGISYGQAMWGNRQMWWTPRSMALPLDETDNHFQLLVGNERLQKHIERSSITAVDTTGRSYRVVPDDVRVRVNNWYKVRGSFLHSAVYAALMLGASITCLILGAVKAAGKREKTFSQQDAAMHAEERKR